MRPLANVNEGDLIASGLFPSLAPNQRALWKTGENVEFIDGRVQKLAGVSQEGTVAGTVRAIEQANVNGNKRLYFATHDKLWKWDTGVLTEIGSGYTGFGYWSLVTFGEWLIATNDYNPPQVWKNTPSAAVNLAGVIEPRYRLVKKFQNHIIGIWGQSVGWSSRSDPETWVPEVSNSAGDLLIRDLDGDIVAAQPLGQSLALYSHDSMVLLTFLGDPLVFGTPGVPVNGIGAVSDSSVVPVGARNYGLSRKGFFVTDGLDYQQLGSPQVNRWLKATIDWNDSRRTVGLHDEVTSTVKWFFPKAGGGTAGLSFNYLTQAWSILSLPVTAAAEHQVLDGPILAQSGNWGFLGVGTDNGDNPLVCTLQSMPFDAGDREIYKRWDKFRLDAEVNVEGEYRVGFHDTLDEDPDWDEWEELTFENDLAARDSVYLTIQFRASVEGANLIIGGFGLYGEPTGSYF